MNNESAQKKYKFSIVTAVYNVELFLEETIESVINQDIGFDENVQLILIDDGSSDKSGEVCDKFHRKYPKNIVVIHKKNGGVSEARNEGLKHVSGEYVNFLDGDDKLDSDALSKVYNHFKNWKDSVDIVTIPLCYFDAKLGNHILNYKFKKGSRIIDLDKEWDKPLLSSSASFFKYETIKEYCFDTKLAYAEDAKLIQQILLRKKKYGVVADTQYLYRKRSEGFESAIQSGRNNKKWYLDYVVQFSLWSLENAKKVNNGMIPLFVQNTVMYDLQWRINTKESPSTVLDEGECSKYYTVLKTVLKHIDDKVIMKQRWMDEAHKFYTMKLKYDSLPGENRVNNNIEYFYGGKIQFLECDFCAKFQFIEIKDDSIEVEGEMFLPEISSHERIDFCLFVNGVRYLCEKTEKNHQSKSLGRIIAYTKGFKCNFPVEKNNTYEVKIGCEIDGYYVERKNIEFGKFFPISNKLWNTYYACKPYILTYRKNALYLQPYTVRRHLHHEISFLKAIKGMKEAVNSEIIKNRILAHVYRLFKRNEIWLISDRIHKADDNGEFLFEYLNQEKPSKIKYYFAISKEATDYKRLCKSKKVIEFRGEKYKFLSLCGAKIISSQADDYVFRPFRKESWYYADLLQDNKFVFLQHGVIKDNLSRELEKCRKNIRLFITSTKAEYDSILKYPYGYDENVVKLTGMPRHDKLYNASQKCITVMPSWRSYLVKRTDNNNDLRSVRVGFENSLYNKMYSELLTNQKLLSFVMEQGYKLCFLSHINMEACTERMHTDENVTILSSDNSVYREVLAETSLLITDYSAAAFDFAYLKKPVLYLQADKEEFLGGKHIYDQGYFDYERDGFGEVTYSIDTMINLIIEYVESDCKVKEKYKRRIESTFINYDKKNVKRVFDEIQKL